MDMIMVYRIIHGLDGSLFNMYFVYHDVPTKSNGYKLLVAWLFYVLYPSVL